MTDREWRTLADELERLCDDFTMVKGADAGLAIETADALVDRARILISIIRSAFQGN